MGNGDRRCSDCVYKSKHAAMRVLNLRICRNLNLFSKNDYHNTEYFRGM
jgi:hypothetical protein